MTVVLMPTSQSVKVTMTQVQYDLLAAGITDDQPMFEQLLMSYCQQIQRSQDLHERAMIQEFVETADPEQRATVLSSITDLQAGTAVLTKG